MDNPPSPQQNDPRGQREPGSTSHHRIFSCERCTRRKRRCDKLLPTCTPCRKAGLDCTGTLREVYVSNRNDRKGVVTTLLEYVAALEAKLGARGGGQDQQLSDALDLPALTTANSESVERPFQQIPTDPSAHSAVAADDQLRLPTLATSSAQNTSTTNHSGMNMNHLSLSVVAEPRSRAGEFLKHLSTPRLVAGVTETFGGDPECTGRVDRLWEAISQYIRHPSGSAQRLHVPREETTKALNTYLQVVDFRYPRLPAAKVRSGMNAISAGDGGIEYDRVINTNPAHIFMAYMVVAIVPLVGDSYPISQGSWVSVHLLSKCLKLLNRVFLQEDGVDIIQCLHLLIILSIHCSTAGSSWHLVGFALSKCIALGYHREEERDITMLTEGDVQQRRWAFWGCYLLDRLVCAGLGRPFSIEDEDISVPLPTDTSPVQIPGQASCLMTNDPSASSQLQFQTDSYIHLFRYAKLLSLAAHTRVSPDQSDAVQSLSFDDLLGQALYWRTTSPTRANNSIGDINSYQTSLYNTLLLRIGIREIEDSYVLIELGREDAALNEDSPSLQTQNSVRYKGLVAHGEGGHGSVLRSAPPTAAQVFQQEHGRIHRINLLGMCCAVARSLDRSRMTSRPYLSFLTGYSALSMGLACLFHLTVSAFAGYEKETDMSTLASLPLSTFSEPSLLDGHALYTNPSGLPGLNPGQPKHNNSSHWDSEQNYYYNPQFIIDLACRKLEVAGRQFPRLQEYRMVLENLRNLVGLWSTHLRSNTEGFSILETITSFRRTSIEIGPPQLKSLAEIILYLMTLI